MQTKTNALGARIREARLFLRMTQDDLACEARISKGFLSEVENGNKDVATVRLRRIADALGVSLDWLVRGEETAERCDRVVELVLGKLWAEVEMDPRMERDEIAAVIRRGVEAALQSYWRSC